MLEIGHIWAGLMDLSWDSIEKLAKLKALNRRLLALILSPRNGGSRISGESG